MKNKQTELLEQPKKAKRGKAKARGNGEGSYRQLPSGSWHWEIRLKGQYHHGTKANKTAALNELARVKTDFARGVLASADKTTFEDYTLKWLKSQKHLSQNTRRMYESELGFAIKTLGKMKLSDIRPTHLKAMLEKLSNQIMKAGAGKGKPMSTRTLGMIRTRVKAVFSEAVRDQLLYVNPADAVRRVKASKDTEEFEGTALDFDQVAHLQQLGEALYEAGRCTLYPAIFAAAALGLRRGEVMGLRWQDIDLERNVLSVRQNLTASKGLPFVTTPKTKNSIRDIPIPPSLRVVLEIHKAVQAKLTLNRGDKWQASSFVFATELGTPTHPANLGRALSSILEWSNPAPIEHKVRGKTSDSRAYTLEERLRVIDRQYRPNLLAIIHTGKPLPRISPHDLRHTAGTLMLRRGVPVEVVSKILGHARVSITLDVYRHVSDLEKRAQIVDLFEHRLPAPVVAAVPIN